MDEIIVQGFPQNDLEALAMLYVQHQDLTDITPEELLRMYDRAYETMAAVRKQDADDAVEWVY